MKLERKMRKILFLVLFLILAACTPKGFDDRPLEEMYSSAMDALLDGNYYTSSEIFEDIERQYPYSEWAKKAQIMAAYCYHKIRKYDQSIAILESFLKLHPVHELSSYANYLVGMNYYLRVSDPKRDGKFSEDALSSFEQMIKKYPNSIYVNNAKERILILKEVLASKEIEVGRSYQKEDSYLSALGRYQNIIQKHQGSEAVPEAYYRLAEILLDFGDVQRAEEALNLLEKLYPKSIWTTYGNKLMKK